MVSDTGVAWTREPPVVLVVEGDRDTRDLYDTIFELEGFCVASATDVDGALAQASDLRPDVVITDVGLAGGVDGVGLASRMHACPSTANVPVIAVTGRSLAGVADTSEFSEILQKPVLPDDLVAVIRRVLGMELEREHRRLPEHPHDMAGRDEHHVQLLLTYDPA